MAPATGPGANPYISPYNKGRKMEKGSTRCPGARVTDRHARWRVSAVQVCYVEEQEVARMRTHRPAGREKQRAEELEAPGAEWATGDTATPPPQPIAWDVGEDATEGAPRDPAAGATEAAVPVAEADLTDDIFPAIPGGARRSRPGQGTLSQPVLDLDRREVRQGHHTGDRYIRRSRGGRSRVPPPQPRPPGSVARHPGPTTGAGRLFDRLKRLLIGSPLSTADAAHERLNKIKALAVLSSDALSSVAYATEAVLAPCCSPARRPSRSTSGFRWRLRC